VFFGVGSYEAEVYCLCLGREVSLFLDMRVEGCLTWSSTSSNVGFEGSISIAGFNILTFVVFVVTVTVVCCSIPSIGESFGSDGGLSS
jgi:hypothetical protein